MQSAILKSAAMSLVLSLAVLIIYPATFSNIASAGTSDPGQDKGGPGNLQPHYFYNFGTAVTGGVRCDLDGDGISDFIVGAPMTDRARGAVYVFSGENGHLLGVVRGEASGDRLGYCVACGGDVNQDGANDVVAGAPFADVTDPIEMIDAGKVFLISMNSSLPLDGSPEKDNRGPAVFRWATVEGEEAGARFGWSVSGGGRMVGGDNFYDFIVGSPGWNNGTGKVYVYGGAVDEDDLDVLLISLPSWHDVGDSAGYAVVGDWNFGGQSFHPDFVYSAPYYDRNGIVNAGAVTAVDGSNGSPFGISGANQIKGTDANELFGFSLAGGHFGTAELVADVLVGSPGKDNNRGAIRAFRGGLVLLEYALGSASGDSEGDYFGYSVTYSPEMFGEYDQPQISVGAPGADSAGSGHVKLFLRDDLMWQEVREYGPGNPVDRFGHAVSRGGYVDDEYNRRLLVGAPGAGEQGEVYVFSGSDCRFILTPDSGYEPGLGRQVVPVDELPNNFSLKASPNPFNPLAAISFTLPAAAQVRLEVFNMLGQKTTTVVNEYLQAGTHRYLWDGSKFSSGVYLYRLTAGDRVVTNRMLLLR